MYSADFIPATLSDPLLEASLAAEVRIIEAETTDTRLTEPFTEDDILIIVNDEPSDNVAIRVELVIVDTATPDYQRFINDIEAQANDDRKIEVILLDNSRDGIAQLTQILSSYSDLDAVHLVSHGSDGSVSIGNSTLNADKLRDQAALIASWGEAFAEDGDFLIYGCNLAAGESGREFVDSLAELTGADIAASDDLTGSAKLQGDWDLEYQQGYVETSVAFSESFQQSWQNTLEQITVTTTFDVLDGDADTSSLAALLATPGSDGEVSLREAIIASNNGIGADIINLQEGTYTISSGLGDNTGDLDIYDNLSIIGVSPGSSIIDAGNATTAIEIHDDSAITVSFSNLKVQNAKTFDITKKYGAALHIAGSSNTPNVLLDNVWFTGNTATKSNGLGGAIYNAGNLTITNSLIEGNTADKGAGIYNGSSGVLWLENVTIYGNNATDGDGGGLLNKGTATLRNVTIAANSSDSDGGGIESDGTLYIGNSIVADNTASDDGDDVKGSLNSTGSNIFSDDSDASGFHASDLRNVDPVLGLLANNGGDLKTVAPTAFAIDSGDRALSPNTDSRGYLRGIGTPDIGAFEVGASATTTASYLDQFNTPSSFAGDDGALLWSNDWQKSGPLGYVGTNNNVGETGLYIGKSTTFWRAADLTGAKRASLSVDYALVNFESTDNATIEISTDGSNWIVLDTITGSGSDTSLSSVNYDISAYIDSNTQIRFNGTGMNDGNDYLFIDNVQIELSSVTNTAPTDITPNISSVDENIDSSSSYSVGTLSSVDSDSGESFSYSIQPGGDGALFSIGGVSSDELILTNGWLDYETQLSYSVNIRVTDSALNTYDETLTVLINDLNDAPIITSGGGGSTASVNVLENQVSVITVASSDEDQPANTLSYAISGGADSTLFSIDSSSGVLEFASAPNYEAPADSDSNGIYAVEITVSDGQGGTDLQLLQVTVLDKNETPTAIALSSNTVNEWTDTSSGTTLGTLTTTDPDVGDTASYAIFGGADEAKFSIGGAGSDELIISDGILDFETQASYQVIIEVTDSAAGNYTQSLTIFVNNLNDAPTITSNGGAGTASINVQENQTATTIITASDEDLPANSLSYSISGGVDMALFSVASGSGALTFLNALDFEANTDADANGVYEVEITVSDAQGGTDTQALLITLVDVNEAPLAISPLSNDNIDEQIDTTSGYSLGTLSSTDPDSGDTASYAIFGGLDAAKFSISVGTNELFLNDGLLDFETQSSYEVIVQVTDSGGLTRNQTFIITVNDLNEAPLANAGGAYSINEGDSVTLDGSGSSDPNAELLTYLWDLNNNGSYGDASGVSPLLDWATLQTFGITDNGSYNIGLQVEDGSGGISTSSATLTVTNLAPEIISNGGGATSAVNMIENTTSVTTVIATDPGPEILTYTISGGADQAHFSINGSTGTLDFLLPADKENPSDNNLDNVYEVEVSAIDGQGGSDTQSLQITVTNSNESPTAITLPSSTVNENIDSSGGYSIGTLNTIDPDTTDSFSYAIIGGTDQAKFSIGGVASDELILSDGVLNFERQSDYQVLVQVTDSGGEQLTRLLTISVNDLNEVPSLTNNGGGATAAISVAENQISVTTATASDPDFPANLLTYSISGGTDAALFSIDSLTGVITFTTAPDFETPADASADNLYQLEISVTDNQSATDVQLLSVSVTAVNDNAPVASGDSLTLQEGGTTSQLDNGFSNLLNNDSDADLPAETLTVLLDSSPSFASSFILNADGTFNYTHDGSENLNDSFRYHVFDGVTNSNVVTVNINITNVNDVPTSNADSLTLNEGASAQINLAANDSDAEGLDLGSISIISSPANGIILINNDGSIEYTHDGSETISDNFTYSIADNSGTTSNISTVNLTITPLNDAPTTTGLADISVTEDAADSVINLASVFNDADNLSSTLIYTIEGNSDPALVTAGLNAAADTLILSYAQNQSGSAEISIRATDASGSSIDTTFTVTVNSANDAPRISATSATSVLEQTTAVSTVTATDIDTPENNLSFSIIGGADALLFTVDPDSGQFRFKKPPDYDSPLDENSDGIYEVRIQVSDADGGSDSVMILVTVIEDDSAPSATNLDTPQTYTQNESLDLIDIILSDIDSQTLTISLTLSNPSVGVLRAENFGQAIASFEDGNWQASGSVEDLNQVLASLVFIPTDEASENFSVAIVIDDGTSEPLTAVKHFSGVARENPSEITADNARSEELIDYPPSSIDSMEISQQVSAEEPTAPVSNEAETSKEEDESADFLFIRRSIASVDPINTKTEQSPNAAFQTAEVKGKSEQREDHFLESKLSSNLQPGALNTVSSLFQDFVEQRHRNAELEIQASYNNLARSLNQLKDEVADQSQINKTVVGSTIAVSTGLSAGYVIWMLRGGMLVSSVMFSLPAWRIADPLPILTGNRKEEDDDESLQSIIKNKTIKGKAPETNSDADNDNKAFHHNEAKKD